MKKIEFIFGKISYRKNYFINTTRPYCPPVLSSLFFKYYALGVKDFLSDKAKIPNCIFDDRDRMLSFLIGLIIDEGHIDSTQITINMKNKEIIFGLKNICEKLDYKSKITQSKSDIFNGYWRLHILREGAKEFWVDYLLLNKKYPIIDLGWKGEKLYNSFKIISRKIIQTKGNSDLIFNMLKNEQLSVNQIAERLNMTRQGIRYHIGLVENLG